jgi:Tfp pilus assembly protein PilX
MMLRNQRGAVLVTVMIYMLVLAMIGISSMRGTAMEERMASNQWYLADRICGQRGGKFHL